MIELSVVIPTLNSAAVLEDCLQSILEQSFARDRYEIVVADAGSTDRTLEIARGMGVDQVVENPLKTGEAGKAVGIAASSGRFIALIDSDNILESPDWMEKMMRPFADPAVFAAEPLRFTVRPQDPSLSRYFALLGMNDPLCLFLKNYDRECAITDRWTGLNPFQERREGWIRVTLDETNLPTIGANGFVFRRTLLEKVVWQPYYMDIDVVSQAVLQGFQVVAKVDCGIVHLYCARLTDFKRKQERRIRDYLYFNRQGDRHYPWAQRRFWGVICFVFSTLLVFPLWVQQRRGFMRFSDSAWKYHIPVCWITLWVYAKQAVIGFSRGKRRIYSRENWSQ